MKISPQQYAQLLYNETEGLNKDKLKKAISGVVRIIHGNRDEKKLEKIEKEFENIYKKKNNIIEGRVVSCFKIGAKELDNIKEIAAGKFHTAKKNVHLENVIDSSIKGGFIVQVENEIWDGSIKGKMRRLKDKMV